MLQLLDEGVLTDGLGRKIDFANTVVIMTSNVGSSKAASHNEVIGYATSRSDGDRIKSAEAEYRKALSSTFAPEFINRIDDIVIFNTLQMSDIESIIELEISHLSRRTERLGYRIELSAEVYRQLAQKGYEPNYGVRSLKRAILRQIEEPLAEMIVAGEISQGEIVDVECEDQELKLLVRAA